jgi:hypothetical protein
MGQLPLDRYPGGSEPRTLEPPERDCAKKDRRH